MPTSKRISVRLEPRLESSLRRRAALLRKSESVLVREALESYLAAEPKPVSAYDVAVKAGLVGAIKGGPSDLSTNKRYMEGFGEKR